jgi:hypothetical protein
MTDDAKDAGNDPVQDDGNAQAPGTPETDGPNADGAAEVENLKQLVKTLQEKAAQTNASKAEALLYKAQLDAVIRAQSPAARGGDPDAEELARVREFAEGRIVDPETGKLMPPDPVAQRALRLERKLEDLVVEQINNNDLMRITDEAKRNRVAQTFNNNRNRFGDIDAAKRYVEAEELAKANAEKDEEIARLRKVLEAGKRPGPDVVQTHTREVPAAEHNDKMTQAQWNDRAADLTRRRDEGDEAAKRELYKMQLARRDNKLKVEG